MTYPANYLCVWCKRRSDDHRFADNACPLKSGDFGNRTFKPQFRKQRKTNKALSK